MNTRFAYIKKNPDIHIHIQKKHTHTHSHWQVCRRTFLASA